MGGRQETPGRPKVNTDRDLASQLTAMAPPSFFSTLPPLPKAHTNTTISCVVCEGILDRPIEFGCGNMVCLLCCIKWLTTTRTQMVECPCCTTPLVDHAHPPSRVTMNVLGSQLVECTKGCNRVVKADQYLTHLHSKCQAFFEHSIYSPSRSTIRDLLEKDDETPTTPTERKVANHIIRRLMAESKEEILQVPTRGQV